MSQTIISVDGTIPGITYPSPPVNDGNNLVSATFTSLTPGANIGIIVTSNIDVSPMSFVNGGANVSTFTGANIYSEKLTLPAQLPNGVSPLAPVTSYLTFTPAPPSDPFTDQTSPTLTSTTTHIFSAGTYYLYTFTNDYNFVSQNVVIFTVGAPNLPTFSSNIISMRFSSRTTTTNEFITNNDDVKIISTLQIIGNSLVQNYYGANDRTSGATPFKANYKKITPLSKALISNLNGFTGLMVTCPNTLLLANPTSQTVLKYTMSAPNGRLICGYGNEIELASFTGDNVFLTCTLKDTFTTKGAASELAAGSVYALITVLGQLYKFSDALPEVPTWGPVSGFNFPGALVVDTTNNFVYVANTGLSNTGTTISKVNTSTGAIIKLNWSTGLSGPTSMVIYGEYMYVINNTSNNSNNNIAQIRLATGEIVNATFLSGFTGPIGITLFDSVLIVLDANGNIVGQVNLAGSNPAISNICFPAGTPVQTDQGVVPIERIQPNKHTLAGQAIKHLTQTVTLDTYLICIEPHALGQQYPTAKTILTKDHLVLYKEKMVPAERFLNLSRAVKKVKYTGEVLYNVLLADHRTMRINNLVCETLHPDNAIAQLYKSPFSAAYKSNIITVMNDSLRKKDEVAYKNIVNRLKY